MCNGFVVCTIYATQKTALKYRCVFEVDFSYNFALLDVVSVEFLTPIQYSRFKMLNGGVIWKRSVGCFREKTIKKEIGIICSPPGSISNASLVVT